MSDKSWFVDGAFKADADGPTYTTTFDYSSSVAQGRRYSMSMAMPATTAIKGGWRMFWLGVWSFIRRRSVDIEMGWDKP